MRVLIVITHGNVGGATNFVFWLAKGLREIGVDVKVGFGKGEYLREKLEREKIPFVNFRWLRRTYNPSFNLFFIFEIRKFLEDERFDVVHFNSSNSLFGAFGAKFTDKKPKTVFTFHGLSILDPNYKKYSLMKFVFLVMFKFLLNFIDIPVFVSKNNLDVAKSIGLVKDGAVVYNGIPKPEFYSREDAERFFEEKIGIELRDKFVIGSIGRLDYQKNYEFLIRIFNEILKLKQNATCIIVGDGPYKGEYYRLIKTNKLEGKVFLIGKVQDALKYLKRFDLFVLPSRYEGLPLTLIEALFAEIPILASDVGGNREIVGEVVCYKFDNVNDFLEKFKIIENMKLDFTRLQNRFILKNMSDEYFRIYKSVISKYGVHSQMQSK